MIDTDFLCEWMGSCVPCVDPCLIVATDAGLKLEAPLRDAADLCVRSFGRDVFNFGDELMKLSLDLDWAGKLSFHRSRAEAWLRS